MMVGVEGSGSMVDECRTDIQQLGNCLMFATGKSAEPTKECCNTVNGIKDRHPVCLCFFIGEAHNGSQTIKSLGVQESKLLQLPDACHLVNASLTNCPMLLGISPTSPAAAIFMNKNGTTSAASTTPSKTSSDNSSGIKHHGNGNGVLLLGSLIVTVLVTIIPIGVLQFLF